MDPERTAVCATCCFYQPHSWSEDIGECRRMAPAFEGWPYVKLADWCAEWYGGEADQDEKPEVVN